MVTVAARLALGTGVVLTLGLAAALVLLDLRLFSRVVPDVPPDLPGLTVGLALGAASFLFLGWRLLRGGRVGLGAYRATLGIVLVSVVILARQVLRLFGADWPVAGSVLLGAEGLTLATVALLGAPPTRATLVKEEDLAAEVEVLVAEIQEVYRRLPIALPRLTTWEVVRYAIVRPARALGELRVRPHLELGWVVPLLVVLWPRLTIYRGPDEAGAALVAIAIEYGLWLAIYDVGKAAMFWGIARAVGRPVRYASAFGAVMLLDVPSLTTYLISNVWHGQYMELGAGLYSRLGLAPFVTVLMTSSPPLFDALAKVDLLHVWTLVLWWLVFTTLVGVGGWVAVLLTAVTFPGAHVFAWAATLFVSFVGGH